VAALLSAESFQSIAAALKSDDRGKKERRRLPRVGICAKIEIYRILNEEKTLQKLVVSIRDLSRGGLSFVSAVKFLTTNRFIVQLPRAKSIPVHLLCQVIRINEQSAGQKLIGCQIISELSPVEFRSLIEEVRGGRATPGIEAA
jgi:hypothetical protein